MPSCPILFQRFARALIIPESADGDSLRSQGLSDQQIEALSATPEGYGDDFPDEYPVATSAVGLKRSSKPGAGCRADWFEKLDLSLHSGWQRGTLTVVVISRVSTTVKPGQAVKAADPLVKSHEVSDSVIGLVQFPCVAFKACDTPSDEWHDIQVRSIC